MLPLSGWGRRWPAVPIALVGAARRARATFAIVTLTLLFVVQQLAFNLRSLTNGSQGIVMPSPPFPVAHYERPFYFAMLAVFALRADLLARRAPASWA